MLGTISANADKWNTMLVFLKFLVHLPNFEISAFTNFTLFLKVLILVNLPVLKLSIITILYPCSCNSVYI
jgi:hypothetical protein